MSTSDPVIADFERFLNTIPDTFTLQQWQFAYKKVIFTMGLKILNKFPQNAFGPDPSSPLPPPPPGNGAENGGEVAYSLNVTVSPTKGRYPWAMGGGPTGNPIIHVWQAATELAPPPPPPPPGG
jgi:hypothetical protein